MIRFLLATLSLLTVSAQESEAPSLSLLKRLSAVTQSIVMFDQLELQEQSKGDLVPLKEEERVSGRLDVPAPAEGMLTATIDGADITFSDLPLSAWFTPYIRSAMEEGFLSGYKDAAGHPTGIFGPANSVTIAEIAKIAVSAAGIDQSTCGDGKNPASKGQWHAGVIACAEKNGWVLYGDGTVNPTRPALRGEVVVTLLQAFGVKPTPLFDNGPFTDVTPSTQYAAAIAKAKVDGLVRGYSDANGNPTGSFGPTDPVTRAEAAKILMLATEKYR